MGDASVDFRLYLVTDRKLFADSAGMLKAVEAALQGGLKAVQLREKDLPLRDLLELSYKMRELTARYHAKLFINDRADVALAVEADGVHLGLTGIPASTARKAGEGRLLAGASAHSLKEAKQAEADGADFITVGPLFETPSKMRYGAPLGLQPLRDACSALKIPVFGIGGITLGRASEVKRQGACGAALISAILKADDIRKTTEEFMRELL